MTPAEKAEHSRWFAEYRDKGDMAAFERVLNAYNKPIFNYLVRLLGNRDEAEDALQEVWGKVIKQASSYKDQGLFSSWLYRIAHNHCLDHYRRQNSRVDKREVVENDEGLSWLDIVSSEGQSPFDELAEQEFMHRLEEALQDIPERIREVYLLRTFQDVPFKEIAEIQNSPIGTVLSRMSQAVKQLKEKLSDFSHYVESKVAEQR